MGPRLVYGPALKLSLRSLGQFSGPEIKNITQIALSLRSVYSASSQPATLPIKADKMKI